jgi:hypothetical protein
MAIRLRKVLGGAQPPRARAMARKRKATEAECRARKSPTTPYKTAARSYREGRRCSACRESCFMVLTTEGKIMPPQLSRILKLSWCKTVRYRRQRPKSAVVRSDCFGSNLSVPGFQGTVGEGPESAPSCRRTRLCEAARLPRTCHSQNRRDWLSWVITRDTFAIPSFVWAAEPAEATQILNPSSISASRVTGSSSTAQKHCTAGRASRDPGIVVHGVALKPGKPLCLAVTGGKPVVILPGFPTSAISTFHEFVAPVIRAFAGLPAEQAERLPAVLPMRITSELDRTEYLMVSLVRADGEGPLSAYPNSKGSGAVTAFSQADGFITIDQHVEGVPAGTPVEVQLIGHALLADLVIIGSHCVGLDVLIGRLQSEGISVKALNVGSTGGLAAAKRGECDIAAIHLMDPETGNYNRPFLTPALHLIPGYRRLQGLVYRKGDPRFEGRSLEDAIGGAIAAPDCVMVNRNAGSGTRILTDRLLGGARPVGYWSQPRSHNAVGA